MPNNPQIWDNDFFTSEVSQNYFNLSMAPLNVIQFFSNIAIFIFTYNLTAKKKLGLFGDCMGPVQHPSYYQL